MTTDLMGRKIVDYEARRSARRLGGSLLEPQTRQTLRRFRPVLESHLGEILDDFAEYVAAWPECRALLDNEQGMTCLQRTQGRHWLALFNGVLDHSFFLEASRIGQAHERVGLEPRWYMGAYCHAMNRIIALAVETYRDDPARLASTVQAINRVVELDMELAVSVYNDTAKAKTAAQLNAEACGDDAGIVGFEPLRPVESDPADEPD
ncbi:MAG: protoglobin domain-containing protein [Alphaproteobacteria bacterium]|nr:protoglobin domain-containing protein [Pseudomonadota bacterium]